MILFRWASHVASIVILIALSGSYAYAQQRGSNANNQAATQAQAPPTQTTIVEINQVAPAPRQPAPTGNQNQSESLWHAFQVALVDPVTLFTGLLTLFSILQWKAMVTQSRETARAAKAAEDAVLLTNAPKVIVHEIDVPETMYLHRIAAAPKKDQTLAITADVVRRLESQGNDVVRLIGSFRMTNKGGSEADTQSVEAMLWVGAILPQSNPVVGTTVGQQHWTMPAGFATRIDFDPIILSIDQQTDIRDKGSYLWAIGRIVYTNKIGNRRTTGFARRFNIDTGRFDRVPDQDYDYED